MIYNLPFVCRKLGRKFIACEIDKEIWKMATERIAYVEEELDYGENFKSQHLF